MIFDLLRSIPSRALVRDYSAKSDLLEVIIKWLEVSVSIYGQRTKSLICVQELGPERPSDLYNRFQGEMVPMIITRSYHKGVSRVNFLT